MQKVDLQLQDVKVQSNDGPIKVQPSKVVAEKFSRAVSKSCPQRCRQSPEQSWGDIC